MELTGALIGGFFAYKVLEEEKKEKENLHILQNAYIQFQLKNYKEALKLLKISKKTSTPTSDYFILKGKIQYDLGKHKSACKNFQNAIYLDNMLDEMYVDTYFFMGDSKRQLGDYENAIKDFDNSLHYLENIEDHNLLFCYEPEYFDYLKPYIFAGRGEANLILERFKFAISDYKTAIDLGIDDPSDNYGKLGYAKFVLNKYASAIKDFNKAINLGTNNESIYLFRGCSNYELKNFQSAIDDFEKVLEINPNNNEEALFHHRGCAKYELGHFQDAIDDFDQAIQINPRDYAPFKYRGIAKYHLEEYKGAIKDFDQAIQINPDDSECYELKDLIFQKINIQSNNVEDEDNSSKDLTKTILIVEDETKMQIFIKNFLSEKSQHKIISVSNARDALSLIKANKVDLVVTDVMLPDMDGISLSSEIRKFNNLIEIIWISALKSNQFGEILDDLEISKVFSKPFDPKELKNFVNTKLT